MTRQSLPIAVFMVALLPAMCAMARTPCPQPDAAKGIHASGVYADGVVTFEPSSDPDHPVDVMLYRQAKSCAGSRIDSYSFEGAPPVIEAVFAFPLSDEPHLFVIVSWAVNHRGLRTLGKLYQVHAYGKDESGGMVADAGVATRNDMTGIEGMVEDRPSHFHGKTPAEVKKLVDGGKP